MHIDFLQDCGTANAVYYCNLLDETKLEYQRKRHGFSSRKVLQDNAHLHIANLSSKKQERMFWTPLEHPPYSPDLSPCDYHMFGSLKESLEVQRFYSNDGVKVFVPSWFDRQPPSFYENSINKLPVCWGK